MTRLAGCGHEVEVRPGPVPALCLACRPIQTVGSQRETIASWRQSLADGTASSRCDETIRLRHAYRGIPDRLVDAIIGETRVAKVAA